jgi:hypothetical protein
MAVLVSAQHLSWSQGMADAKLEIKVGALYGRDGLLVADIELHAATGVLAARCKYA